MSDTRKYDYDITIIGAGPGGYVSAIRAAQLGAKVAIIEKSEFGGTCLNNGCIPSKALLASAELIHRINEAEKLNVSIKGDVTFDWRKIQQRKNKVLQMLRGGIERLFKANKINVFSGTAKLAGRHKIDIGGNPISSKKVIIAVGSKPTMISSWPKDKEIIATSDEALHWDSLPKSLLIVGGGVIGCEFACMMKEFGVDVIIVEMLDELLPNLDKELGASLRKSFTKRNIKCYVGTKIEDLKISEGKAEAKLSNSETIIVDRVLVATGRKPNTEDLGLETVGIRTNQKGFIDIAENLQTNVAGYYCIGDANGRSLLAHSASAQGCVAVENALGGNVKCDWPVPSCIYTFPEIGSVGLSEQQARDKGIDVKIGNFPIGYLGKAMAVGQTEGFVKIVRNSRTDEILGVHILGHNATECIAAAGVALHEKMKVNQLAEVIFSHPTISEAIKESAEAALSLAIHLPPQKMSRIMAEVE